jgi:hypothetical protein
MAFAQEEAKRLPAMARAERDEMRAKYAEERKALRRELQDELEASRAAVADEAAGMRRAAEAEAARVVTEAKGKADQARQAVTQDLHRAERRLAVLRTALADAESRFRRLAATAANEAGTLTALADQDVIPSEPAPPLRVMVDLTEEEIQAAARMSANTGFRADEEPDASEVAPDDDPLSRNREEGFYQRRLAGLRDRLEKSGHPPE